MIIGSREFDFQNNVYLMGILNVTPDSFSDGGCYLDPEQALDHALQMEAEGADVIDIGGESSRPGAKPVDLEEEWRRLAPVLKKIIPKLRCPLSVDTTKSEVARRALLEGVSMINDISALSDPDMASVIAKAGVPVILMHMKGTPETMQEKISYEDVLQEIENYLRERIQFAIRDGIDSEKILIDLGIGFGKRFEDNLAILTNLQHLKELGYPLVFGASRKSFIRKIFGEDPASLLVGSVVAAFLAAQRGASLLRVHDVKETRKAIELAHLTSFR